MATKTARRTALALAGLAVTGTAVMGLAGPAQAAAPTTHARAGVATHFGWDGGEDRVAGVFRSYWECQRAGFQGERFGQWDDYSCDHFGSGGWAGAWQTSWGRPFGQFWGGGGWRYRGVWVLRVDDCD